MTAAAGGEHNGPFMKAAVRHRPERETATSEGREEGLEYSHNAERELRESQICWA